MAESSPTLEEQDGTRASAFFRVSRFRTGFDGADALTRRAHALPAAHCKVEVKERELGR